MVDGVHFGQHTYVVALGIGIDGVKHPLAVDEDSTENATLVTDLITGLRERGLDVTRPILAVLDGARALPRAVKDVFGQPLIQRCQQYKIRNVTGKLPDWLKQVTARWMRQMRMLSMPSFRCATRPRVVCVPGRVPCGLGQCWGLALGAASMRCMRVSGVAGPIRRLGC